MRRLLLGGLAGGTAALVVTALLMERVEPLLAFSALIGGVGFGWLAWRGRALDTSGAVAASLFGWTLLCTGEPVWIVPGLAFFASTAVLSRWRTAKKAEAGLLASKGTRRDVEQVLANGGIAWSAAALSLVLPETWLLMAYLGALAVAAADTWATEVGTLGDTPRLVTTGRRVPPGTSGAVSVLGSLAAVAGAACVAVAALPWLDAVHDHPYLLAGVVVLGGVGGSFVDSLLGATLQAQFYDPNEDRWTERRPLPSESGQRAPSTRGLAWMQNEHVNALATLVGGAFAAACFPG